MLGKNINLYLMDGKTNGRIKYTYSNWTGIVYKIPRKMLEESKNIDNLKGSGVYFLFGEDKDTARDFIYIGQANLRKNGEGVLLRVKEHFDEEKIGFWHTAIMVVKSDSSLGATEISYLENRFYLIAKEANDESGRYIVRNGNEPNIGNITEEKASELEHFIIDVLTAVGVLGFRVFDKIIEKPKEVIEQSPKEKKTHLDETFYLKIKKSRNSKEMYTASMVMTLDGFVLLKGSEVNPKTKETASPKYLSDKEKNKVFLDENNRTTKDILFDSPTGAAVFVVGYNISGPKNWKNLEGESLEKLEI